LVSGVAQAERAAARRAGPRRWTPALAALLSLLVIAAAGVIVVDASVGSVSEVPYSPPIAGWLASIGIGELLGNGVWIRTLIVWMAAYAGLIVLVHSRSNPISSRWAIGLVAATQLIVFVGPVLVATDVFSYIAYARLGVLHGINPYVHGPAAAPGDAFYPYISADWIRWPTPYGSLFTLLTYPVALLGIDGAVWGMKTVALLAGAGTLALIWRCARTRGLDPVAAIVVVGLNPFYVLYALGGSHNDLIMLLAMMAGVSLSLVTPRSARREAEAAAAIVAGAFVKATAAVLLPFMIVSKRRLAPILGALAAFALLVIVGFAVFGVHGINLLAGAHREAGLVSSHSFVNKLAYVLGRPGVSSIDHALFDAGLVMVFLYLLWRTWRGYDWIAASGWALLAIAVSTSWLMAWYTIWPLPLAVISRDRRLLVATLCVQVLWV
jgi:hypothetical protein